MGNLAGLGEAGPFFEENQGLSFQVNIGYRQYETATFKVTLVWSDPPHDGPHGRAEEITNVFELVVKANGKERHGNVGKRKVFDRSNNVQQVVWSNIPVGKVRTTIGAYKIWPGLSQSFAYCWRVAWENRVS
jgi:hypothetical protein